MEVSGFTVDNFGKLYRSCGNCKTQAERHVIFSDITASEGKTLAGEFEIFDIRYSLKGREC